MPQPRILEQGHSGSRLETIGDRDVGTPTRIPPKTSNFIFSLVNFKLMILRAQEELRAQILGGLGSGSIFSIFVIPPTPPTILVSYSRIVNNVNWLESRNPRNPRNHQILYNP